MNTSRDDARLALQKARAALRNGQLNQARQWAEQAAALAPQMEDPWLVLAAAASPRASLEYVQRALKINPESDPARRAMEWALDRLRQPDRLSPAQDPSSTGLPGDTPNHPEVPVLEPAAHRAPSQQRSWRNRVLAVILLGFGCVVFAAAAWSTGLMPAVASLIQQALTLSGPTQLPHWAPVTIPKPTYAPQGPSSQGSVHLAVVAPPKVLPASIGDTLLLSTHIPTGQTTETGPDYVLPDGPYVMFFYKDYGLHGTYWHHNFGAPVSHGCVNLSVPDAEWLYSFSSVGTPVDVHY